MVEIKDEKKYLETMLQVVLKHLAYVDEVLITLVEHPEEIDQELLETCKSTAETSKRLSSTLENRINSMEDEVTMETMDVFGGAQSTSVSDEAKMAEVVFSMMVQHKRDFEIIHALQDQFNLSQQDAANYFKTMTV